MKNALDGFPSPMASSLGWNAHLANEFTFMAFNFFASFNYNDPVDGSLFIFA